LPDQNSTLQQHWFDKVSIHIVGELPDFVAVLGLLIQREPDAAIAGFLGGRDDSGSSTMRGWRLSAASNECASAAVSVVWMKVRRFIEMPRRFSG